MNGPFNDWWEAAQHNLADYEAWHSDAQGIIGLDDRVWGDPAARGDSMQQTLGMPSQTELAGEAPQVMYMQKNCSRRNDIGLQGSAPAASDSSHRMSGEIAIELSPATGLSHDVEMNGQYPNLDETQCSPTQHDGQRPSNLPKQAPGRANSMAQSITRFFRRAKPVCEVRRADVAPTHDGEVQANSTKQSRKRGLGHLQATSFQPPRSSTPSCYGLVAETEQPNPAKRIPGMFKAKRMLASQSDTGKHIKDVKRPTLATTVFAGRRPQTLLSDINEPENYTISGSLQSVFDMADTTEELENGKAQLMPYMATPVSPADSSGMLPCGMAPHIPSPTASHHMDRVEANPKTDGGRLALQIPDLCTPEQSSADGRSLSGFAFESVHTPPEVTLSAVLECPGAPVKKRGDTDAFEVVSRLSSLSVDSIDMCGSPFAPGAPAWSPRAEAKLAQLQFQEQAKNRALEDDVRFVIDGFREGSALADCALKAMSLFADARSRQGMAEVGLYAEVMCAMSVACGSTAFQSSEAYDRGLAHLATCQAVLLHCTSCVRSEAAKRVTATQLCGIFRDLLKQRSYLSVQLTPDHAQEFARAIEGCKAARYFPPGFQHSALALLLVAARVCLEGKLFAEKLKDVAVSSGFCRQLQEIATENMAVLTGKQPPTFTKRTNSCMWFADTAQACLERITAAHASNCAYLITSRVKFGSDGTVGFPAIPLSCAQFARRPQLMENTATQLCIAANLQLLMNLTHSTSGSDCVMLLGGITALAHLVCHSAVATPKEGPFPVAQGPEDLPDTQDIFGSVPHSSPCHSQDISQRSSFQPDAAAACSHQQQITSALCVLVNMVEHSPAAGACIAQLDFGADQCDVLGPQNSAANSPSKSAQEPAQNDIEQHASQPVCSQQSSDSVSRTRLASGSRRRRRNGARPVVEETEVQPKAARVALKPVQTSNADHTTRGVRPTADSAQSFVRFLCMLLIGLWERGSSATCISETELASSVGIVQLYTSILLGALVHSTPGCRQFIAQLLDIDRLVGDMETGLNFYATHGAIEASSKLFFQQAIESLKQSNGD